MPFHSTPSRNAEALTEFFEVNLKRRIEADSALGGRYIVRRSDDTFDINPQIIRDLYTADVVICDLSGHNANPNVMYELGVRLALSNKPVILIRETSPDNTRIFDIGGFYAYEYETRRYPKLEEHVVEQLRRLESGELPYASPVLKILATEPSVLREISRQRSAAIMESLTVGAEGYLRALAPSVDRVISTAGLETPTHIAGLVPFLEENAERLTTLDWSGFRFRLAAWPAMTAYLVEFPLQGLLDAKLAARCNEYVAEYYGVFIATEAAWAEPDYHTVHWFGGETYLLSRLSRVLTVFLRRGASEAPPEELINKLLRLSKFDLSDSTPPPVQGKSGA